MKRRLFNALLLVTFIIFTYLISLLGLNNPAYASVNDFKIESFKADYYLSRNELNTSVLKVEEEITAIFPEYDQNHGILRAIPESYQNHTVSLNDIKVTNTNNEPVQFSESSSNGNRVLKIGDPNRYVRGKNIYKISYSLKNVINFQEQDEFYWDINGDQWDQPFGTVQSTLHLTPEIAEQLTGNLVCYSGIYGSKESNCSISKINITDTRINTYAYNLSPRETVTQVVGFKKGTFNLGPEIEAEKRQKLIAAISVVIGLLLLPLITFIVMFDKWRKYGRDPKGRGVIIPEYVSPKGFNVLSSDFVLNQKVSPTAISAAIIEMAVSGYLRIIETETKEGLFKIKRNKYSLEIIKNTDKLSKEQLDILNKLFNSNISVGQKINIEDTKNNFYTIFTPLTEYLAKDLATKGYFIGDPHKIKNKYNLRSLLVLIAGFILLFIPVVGLSLILSSVIAFFFSSIMPVRSQLGVHTRDYLLGLKEYINLAEKDRLAYLQSPQGAEKTPIDINNKQQAIKLFEDLLPYAILFKLEEQWAKQFSSLYQQEPTWYRGSSGVFNSIAFSNAISSFSSVSTTSFAPPSSSGSSGFGGGAGGGGGGGGGGGW